MAQLVKRLNPKDEFKVRVLKEKYGYNKTSELIRYLLNSKLEEWIRRRGRSNHSNFSSNRRMMDLM